MVPSKWPEVGVEVGTCHFHDGYPLGLWAGEMACFGILDLLSALLLEGKEVTGHSGAL